MFQELDLKPVYNSYTDDLPEDFYNPILSNSVEYKRVSAYFSARALARFSVGLEHFYKNGGKFFLIINKQIEEEDFIEMKAGIELKESIRINMISSLNQNLDFSEVKGISNLAYLIATDRIEIKVAFTSSGIFHDKFGFFHDCNGNVIYFRGSNNETEAAIDKNYEAFDISCSWFASEFELKKMKWNLDEYNSLWGNKVENVFVIELDEIIKKELIKFSKGKLICEEYDLMDNLIVIDLDAKSKMFVKNGLIDKNTLFNSSFYILEIKHSVTSIKGEILRFKNDYSYMEYRRIISKFEKFAKDGLIKIVITKRILSFIESMDLMIEKRRNVGINIKNLSPLINPSFLKYRAEVDSLMTRKLREKQMWDSFFMYSMRKSCNFSVPGSGKTAAVLGMFAYLKKTEGIKRIVMIGPKSSFDTWRNEYKICFSGQDLKVFDWQENMNLSVPKRLSKLTTETGGTSLVLLNYDALPTIAEEAKGIISEKVLVVFDEIHKIKRINGYLAGGSEKFSQNAKYIVALTGTPIPNSYADIYNMLNILYRQEYKYYFGFSPMNLVNPTETMKTSINDKLFPFFCRTTKTELGVPAANPDLLNDIRASYEENEIYRILTSKYRNNKFALFIRLLQLESNPKLLLDKLDLSEFKYVLDDSEDEEISGIDFVDYSKELKELISSVDKTSKKKECIDLISKLAADGKSVILWCVFIDSIVSIESELKKLGLSVNVIYGATDQIQRNDLVKKFNNREFQILITNPHTLAESVSLHSSCHDAIYFEFTFNLVHLLQSKDRIHRLGLPDGQYTQYYYLMNIFERNGKEESLDYRVFERLMTKEKTMLDAIEANKLEDVSTSREDIEMIFKYL